MSRVPRGIALAFSEQPDEAACHGAESDASIAHGELPGPLTCLDVPKGSRCQAPWSIEEFQAGAGNEPTDFGMRPAEPSRDPE